MPHINILISYKFVILKHVLALFDFPCPDLPTPFLVSIFFFFATFFLSNFRLFFWEYFASTSDSADSTSDDSAKLSNSALISSALKQGTTGSHIKTIKENKYHKGSPYGSFKNSSFILTLANSSWCLRSSSQALFHNEVLLTYKGIMNVFFLPIMEGWSDS